MKDPILLKKLLKEVDEGRVAVSRSGDLSIFKYSQDTHIQGLWNETNRLARGLIMHDDGTVIARPFPKFFNLGEVEETKLENLPWHEDIEVYEKVDGSCGIGYLVNGTWRLATPGSMESDQAIMGTKILNEIGDRALDFVTGWGMITHYHLEHLPQNCTPVFEIIYPDNRIVVDYKGETFLSLLAIFELNGEEWHPRRVDQIAEKCGFRRPRRYNIDLRSEIPFEENTEGYVARFEGGLRIKIKSPAYLRVHRLLNYMSPKGVIELMRGREYRTTVSQLPKEIAKDFDDIRAYVQTIYDRIYYESQCLYEDLRDYTYIAFQGTDGPTRKELALWIQANVPNELTGFVFALLDNKDISDKIWKLVLEKVKNEKTKEIAVD